MNKLYYFIILLFALVLIPDFGALDRANTQWLYLSCIPFFFLITNFKSLFFKSSLFKSAPLIIYCLFIFQVFLSLFYTNNFSISVIDFCRHLTLFFLILVLISVFKKNQFSFYKLSLIISLFLVYESVISLRPLFYYIYKTGDFFLSTVTKVDIDPFKGLTGNRNIATASTVIKLPFLFYLVFRSKYFLKFIFTTVALLPLLTLFIINSRAALLSLILGVILISFFTVLYDRKRLINLLFVYLIIFSSFSISQRILPNDSGQVVERLESINFTNESSSNRFFLWDNAWDYIQHHPFIGCGIGNWKVESAAYWGSNGSQYIVPFHAHNDFLEFTTELGLIGGLSYLMFFIYILYIFFTSYLRDRDLKYLILIVSFSALFIDSMLNFPFERPIIQSMFVLLSALGIHYNFLNNVKKA